MKSPKKPTVTIGICAYNEAANIGLLLQDIAHFKPEGVIIKKVHLVSDGSSDATVKIARHSSLKNLYISDRRQRKGLAASTNLLLKKCNTDVLILINADIRILDPKFVQKLTKSIADGKADLTSCNLIPSKGLNRLEKTLIASMAFKTQLYESHKNGHNVYTCHGSARALSKKLYSTLRFPHSVGEDAYSYLFTLSHGLKYRYVKNTEVVYKEPSTVKDYLKQSVRFKQSQSQFIQEFGPELVKDSYTLPLSLIIKVFFQHFLKTPMELVFYISLTTYSKLKSMQHRRISNTWEIANSSKQINT